ncbi:MAG: biotin--[acetyl-CoA-carboxylase] ligase [Bacteroidetes bacterium]|nr:MAG: biotin--[acetyl-CoA-carboxylase] ligase [Bacteroidota bacterium]
MSHYNIAFINEVDSTNTFLKELVKSQNLEAPYCVSASKQINGKGQREKTWESEPFSNVLASFLITSLSDLKELPRLNNAAALAVVETLDSLGVKNIEVKWPNDIFVSGKKIAGILTENVIASQRVKFTVVGIGLNVNQLLFKNFIATSVCMELAKDIDIVEVLHKLYDSFYHFIYQETDSLLMRVNNLLYKQGESVTFDVAGRMKEYTIERIMINGNISVQKGGISYELEHHKVKWIK